MSISRTNSFDSSNVSYDMSDTSSLRHNSTSSQSYYTHDFRHIDPNDAETSLIITTPIPTSAYKLETFFFQRFISSVWLNSQAEQWQRYLPSLMNSSPALYFSVMSLSALYMHRTGVDLRAKDISMSLYQLTLVHLQRALYHPQVAHHDATLMAMVIISLYELIDKPGNDSWCSHSRGTAELLKLRGSDSCRDGTGRMLFLTFRGFEVIRAILQFDESFVADEEWTLATSSPKTIQSSNGLLKDDRTTTSTELPDYSAVLFMLGGKTANFQAKCMRLSKQDRLDHVLAGELSAEAEQLERQFHSWRGSLPQSYNGRERPSVITNSPYSSIQEFDTLSMGYQLAFYSAFLLLLHRTVAKYVRRDLTQLPLSCQGYAKFIVKTAEFLTQGCTTASLNVTWPIYMACIALTQERERKWAVVLLRTIAMKGWTVASSAIDAAHIVLKPPYR